MFKENKIGAKWLSGTTLSALAIGLSIVCISADAHAQNADRLEQGFKKGPGTQVSLAPKDTLEVSHDETQIIPSLKGIVIVNDPASVADAGTSADGVVVDGDVVPAGVVTAAKKYLSQPVSLASLDRLTRDMVLAYRAAGLPVVNVVVPPQDVENNAIQIIAVVGRMGKLSVEGNAKDPSYYTSDFGMASGDVISADKVISHLRWKSRRSNRRVDAIYAPGSSFSLTDIALDVKETKPWSVYFGADSTGPGSSGQTRLYPGFILSDLWGLDHELSYQFTTSENGPAELNAHVLKYTLPVLKFTDLELTGVYSGSSTALGNGSSVGKNTQLGATFVTQLDRMGGFNWDARYGFEYKSYNSNFEFGGASQAGSQISVGQFFTQLNGDRRGANSQTSVSVGVWFSPGGLFADNSDAAFDAARSGSTAQYAFLRASVDNTVYLPKDWMFTANVQGQVATGRLPGSELMYLGGLNSVRGFDENVVRGDNGIMGRFELYSPGLALMKREGSNDSLRLFGFFDAGAVSVNGSAVPAVEGTTAIAGTGLGLSYTHRGGVTAKIAYGWKVKNSEFNTRDTGPGQFHFNIIGRF